MKKFIFRKFLRFTVRHLLLVVGTNLHKTKMKLDVGRWITSVWGEFMFMTWKFLYIDRKGVFISIDFENVCESREYLWMLSVRLWLFSRISFTDLSVSRIMSELLNELLKVIIGMMFFLDGMHYNLIETVDINIISCEEIY